MTQFNLDGRDCRDAQRKLDSYLDEELLVETNLDMARHFERCASCAREEQVRRRLRTRLQTAVRLTEVPETVESRVRERLRGPARTSAAPLRMMAIAAAIVVCFGSWLAYQSAGTS